jgi:putative transposase
MVRKRYSEAVRLQVVQEVEQGKPVDEVIQRHGIAEATYYRWRAQIRPSELRDDPRLRQLEEENRQLREVCADAVLEIRFLKQELAKLRRRD